MNARTWALFLVVNVIVSALVVLTILFLWQGAESPPGPTVTPASTPQVTVEVDSTQTPLPDASPTPSDPLVHTVQAGETLLAISRRYGVPVEDIIAANELTNPNVLEVGQTLIIPTGDSSVPPPGPPTEPTESSPETTELPTPLPAPTSSGPPLIEIGQVLGSGDLAAETVIVRNRGGSASLEGWTLSDAEGNRFVFPAITLFSDAQVRVHSTAGNQTPTDLYWGRANPAWTAGELITLRDAAGNVVDTYIVP